MVSQILSQMKQEDLHFENDLNLKRHTPKK